MMFIVLPKDEFHPANMEDLNDNFDKTLNLMFAMREVRLQISYLKSNLLNVYFRKHQPCLILQEEIWLQL